MTYIFLWRSTDRGVFVGSALVSQSAISNSNRWFARSRVVGALIIAGSSLVLEGRRQKWASEERKYVTAERKYLLFAEKRLNALQNAIQLCDFLDSIRPSPFNRLSEEVQADWRRIRREIAAHGALMPESVQGEFKIVLRKMAIEPYAPNAPAHAIPAIPPTEQFRKICLEAIQGEYEKIN
jgi:hypothetical protein